MYHYHAKGILVMDCLACAADLNGLATLNMLNEDLIFVLYELDY